MKRDELIELFYKYRHNQCSAEDVKRLIQYIKSDHDQEFVQRLLDSASNDGFSNAEISDPLIQKSLNQVFFKIQKHKKKPTTVPFYRKRPIQWSAAVLLIGMFFTIWYVGRNPIVEAPRIVDLETHDIAPGGNRAKLTLADGRTITLSEEQTGIVIGKELITYTDDKNAPPLWRQSNVTDGAAELAITTPPGGTYRVTLEDGTNVWLNASSTLTYPLHFSEEARYVKLSGEGYFDVQPDPNTPFFVETGNQVIKVLGTEFNVMAYPDDEEVKTTLVEGSVELWTGSRVTSLKPSEQSSFSRDGIHIRSVNVETYVGWKKGEFVFSGAQFQEAMKQLGRWYDIAVVYDGEVPVTQFYGSFSRDLPLSATLEILKEANINFSVHQTGDRKQLIVKSQKKYKLD